MFSLNNIPSTTTVFSAYTSIAASAMLIRTIVNEVKSTATQLIPNKLQQKILSILEGFYGNMSSQITLVIDEYDGYVSNEMFEASEIYLRTKITPSIDRLKVRKIPREKNLLVSVESGQDITDIFEGVELNWKLSCTTDPSSSDKKYFELSFPKKFNKLVFDSYLPHVMKISKAIQGKNKMPKLYSLDFCGDEDGGGLWGSIKFDHPSTFDTLAMDSKLKNELLEDLDRFVKRREFYKRVGKAWKRGYLLYGPPGTGKSSLIAAMANHLSFNIYDLELANIHSNSQLRQVLVATANRSILIIEDIDCTVESHDRSHAGGDYSGHSQRTLSGLLNFIDGLWSSVGDERIIVFTTNHKDKLDPALLRPGRMDMHIHMSYITPHGFRILVNNYLQINEHFLFEEIDVLIQEVNVTAAEVAEELMKSEDAEIALRSVIDFIKTKKTKLEEKNNNVEKEDAHGSKQEKGKNKRKNNNRKKG